MKQFVNFTHLPNLYDFLSSAEHKISYFVSKWGLKNIRLDFHSMDKNTKMFFGGRTIPLIMGVTVKTLNSIVIQLCYITGTWD